MIYSTLFFLAQAGSPAPGQPTGSPGAGQGMTLMVYMIGMVVIFYFISIRPNNLKQKAHDALVKSLKTGDKVVTGGGIHGLISNVKESTVMVKIAENVKIEVDKSAVTSVSKAAATEA